MPAPIDYGVQIADPTQAFLSAFQAGTSIQDAQFKQQQQVQQAAQQKLIQEGFKKLQSPTATAADYANLSMMLPGPQAEAVRKSFEMLTEDRQKTALGQAGQVFSALKAGKPGIAISLMDQQIDAKRNSGDEAGAKFLETWRDVAKENPQATENYFGYTISQIPGGEKVIESAVKLGGESRAAGLAKPTLDKAVADASAAVADAQKKVFEAADTPSRLLAEADYRSAQTALQRAQTAASEGSEARSLTKFGPELRETIAKADAAVADAQQKLAEAKDTPTRLAAENNLRVAQTAQANAAAAKSKKDLEDEGVKVQSSSILPNGTVVFVTTNGKTRVIGPDGVELTGQERVDAVRDAEQFGADIQQLRSGARKAGEVGQTEAAKAFENVGKIRRNISNLDSAIAALDAGATTGVIASKFPNWKASTIELQNVQRQLGLDIIGSVTFGALSEGELSLALETALPLNMNEPQLKDWLIRKKTAQNKLADYITEQARFLSIPGRSLGDWLIQAEKRGQPPGMTPPGTGAAGAAAAAAPPLPKSATVGGKTYTRPPGFTDAQWRDYLKAQGVTP